MTWHIRRAMALPISLLDLFTLPLPGWAADYHYARLRQERMDSMARAMPIAQRLTLLGQQRVPETLDAQWAGPAHADIIHIDGGPAREIQQMEIQVLSNEIIVAVQGITLTK